MPIAVNKPTDFWLEKVDHDLDQLEEYRLLKVNFALRN